MMCTMHQMKVYRLWEAHMKIQVIGGYSTMEWKNEKYRFFSEMTLYNNDSSIKDSIIEESDYDKKKIINYLKKQKRIAGCPREAIDCMTGEKIADSFSVYNDGEFEWCDFLIYHIEKYNLKLPIELINKSKASE